MRDETIQLFGYPDTTTDGVRLDEFTKIEFEDIMRDAVRRLGGEFCQESFDEYWRQAQERKRASAKQ